MRKIILILSILTLSTNALASFDAREFLSDCGMGIGIGALVGLSSLAFEDEPSEKLNNIARGASLGLYAGVAFSLYSQNARMSQSYQSTNFIIVPSNKNGENSLSLLGQYQF